MRNYYLLLFLLCCLCWGGCQKDPDKYLADNRANIFNVAAVPDSLPADGKSTLLINAYLNSSTNKADFKTVVFTTSQGMFADNDSIKFTTNASLVSGKLVASAYLLAGQVETDRVLVKVSIPRLDTTLIIKFYTARPDSIHSESTVVIASKNYNNQIPVSTYLFRKSGKPTLHQTAIFNAIKSDGTPIGEFIGITPNGSDSSGLIKSTFVTRDSVYSGNIRIISTVQGSQKILKDTTTIFIKPQ